MLNIVLEGIDGSGKSTVSPLVFNLLRHNFPGAIYRTKKATEHADPYVQKQLEALKNQIWLADVPCKDLLGPNYWICLTAAWYAALNAVRLCSSDAAESLHVFDGWYYRSIVKTLLRSKLTEHYLWSLFGDIKNPDIVFLLDVDPEVCWRRTRCYNEAEIGRWAGHDGTPASAFLSHQSRVRIELLRLSNENSWVVLKAAPEMSVDEIAQIIAQHISCTFSLSVERGRV